MKKRLVIIITVAALIISGIGVGLYVILSGNHTLQNLNGTQLSVGEKYLAELNYEKATAVLQEVITVEPNNAQAYLSLSKAYHYMGDMDSEIEILQNGYNATGSSVIENEFLLLSNSNTSGSATPEKISNVEIAGRHFPADTKELVLRECGLTDADLTNLSKLTALERLDISGNNITDMTEIGKLTSLKKLYAANNSITDVSPLSDLHSIEYIGLRGNQIENADPLFALDNLKYLHLSGNKLTSVPKIGQSLQLLYLSGNNLANLSAIKNSSLLFCDISDNLGR